MAKNNKSWIGTELSFLFLAPLLVLAGIILNGILFDTWLKDPMKILEFSAIAYGGIMVLRLFRWIIRALSS